MKQKLRDNLLMVTPDPVNRYVWVGDKAIRKPTLIRDWVRDIPMVTGYYPKKGFPVSSHMRRPNGTKEYNQALNEHLGIPPKKFARVFNAVASSVWIKPVQWYVDKLARGMRGRIDTAQLERIWRHKEILDQARADGLDHLLPILLTSGRTPEEIKKRMGRGRWRKLANNSFSRNKLIAEYGRGAIDLPSTAIPYVAHRRGTAEALKWACENRDKPLKNADHIIGLAVTYTDTQEMCEEMGERFNPNWSRRRMQEEHDRISKALAARSYTSERFDWMERIAPLEVSRNGWTARLLESPAEIGEEATAMKHCVSMYIRDVADREYAVFSVRSPDGRRYSTAGFELVVPEGDDETYSVQRDQHYCAMNDDVDDDAAVMVADAARHELVSRLNKAHGEAT